MFYVYVLLCRDKQNTLYYGFTSNLRRRFEEHKKEKGNIELIYYEAYKCESDARRREIFFKSGWGRNYVKRVLKSYLESIGY